MKIIVEFYRTREADDMHAVIGRETAEAADLDNAIDIARRLSQSLAMPQSPDGMTITDAKGAILYSDCLEAGATTEERLQS